MPKYEFGLPIYEPQLRELDLDYSQPYNFVLVGGAFNASHWHKFANVLIAMGHDVLIPELPISNPQATFDDDAEAVLAEIGDSKNLVTMLHSRAIESGRFFGAVDLSRFVVNQLVSNGGPHTYQLPSHLPHASEDRYQDGYTDELLDEPNGMQSISPEDAQRRFYNDVADQREALWAANNLQPQRNAKNDPSLPFMLPSPDKLPTVVWLGSEDNTLNISRAIEVAKAYVEVVPRLIATGHTPQLSRASMFAFYAIDAANKARKAA